MEGGVEDEDLREVGKHLFHCHVAFEVGFAVEGRKFHVLFPLFKHFIGDDAALGEASACHDAVTGSTDFVEVFDGTIFRMEQGVKHEANSLGVGGTR